MAEIHAASFITPRPWTACEFAALPDSAGAFLCLAPEGFLWGRSLAGEAELLTLAVAPQARRQGQAAELVRQFLARATETGATTAFLEVAQDNAPARALYAAAGFAQAGRRRGYYTRPGQPPVDALVLTRALP
jgi:ribosomal-protein-alanine N-acetyltransferase